MCTSLNAESRQKRAFLLFKWQMGVISGDEFELAMEDVHRENDRRQRERVENLNRVWDLEQLKAITEAEDDLVAEVEAMVAEGIPDRRRGSGHDDVVGEDKSDRRVKQKQVR